MPEGSSERQNKSLPEQSGPPDTKLQRCTTHLKRNILNDVRNGDKGDGTDNLKQDFRTGDRNYTVGQT